MRSRINYQYYVEGTDEKSLVNTLKTAGLVVPGKVEVFNMIQEKLTTVRIRPMGPGTIIVFIYDTDVEKTDILDSNLRFLRRQKNIKDILCIPQIQNLEDELRYSCKIKTVLDITHSSSMKDFKHDFNSCRNLGDRLRQCGFSKEKLWSRQPTNGFREFGNDSEKVKL